MADMDLAALVTAGSEDLDVEYKAWVDTSQPDVRAKLARHLAALANYGGGYLIFGVDDTTRKPQGTTNLDRALFGEDAISSIVKRYLDPPFQCQTAWATFEGVEYPVVIVPSHGSRPVIAKADGPQDGKGRPVGIRVGEIYVRAPGPESVAIKTPEDWTALLERCLSHRTDLLANIMHRAINRPSKPALSVSEMLVAACDATAGDFISQVAQTQIPPEDEAWFRAKSQNFAVNGYALVGNDGELLPIENPYALNEHVSASLRTVFRRSNMPFRHVRAAERAPQVRMAELLNREAAYLEGMRLPAMPVVWGSEDYWRIYEQGVVTVAESYREDHIAFRLGSRLPFLLVSDCLAKVHALLAHARLLSQEIPAVNQIVLRMDWRGLHDRTLCWNPDTVVSGGKKLADSRFSRTFTLPWSELRDSYFSALRRAMLPLFGMFDFPGHPDAATWLTQDIAQGQLKSIDDGMNLFQQ
jgi:Putative DNA-binding domain